MAKLLAISAIRSCDPDVDDAQHINFNDTVMLIFGQNGCGKTTILEAIKYALTGKLPTGCNNGKGFISDPSISTSVETKGQVRLRTTDGIGKDIIIIKSIQVTKIKGGALKFKALNSAINEIKDGIRLQFSGRCIDISNYCAEALQIYPCILNNVLLYHQENSAWPLEEGDKLKDKFDEIFESTRWKQCVVIFIKQFKEHKNKLKLILGKQHKEENKERVKKMKIKLNDKNTKCEDTNNRITRKQEDIRLIEARIHEILKLEEDIGKLEKRLAFKEATRRAIFDKKNSIRRNIITEFPGTDAELLEKIRTFQCEKLHKQSGISQLENRISEVESSIKEINIKIQQFHDRLGQLWEEKRQIHCKCIERNSLIEIVKIHLNLGAQITSYDVDENTESVIDTLKQALEMGQDAIENKMMEIASNETTLQNVIDNLKEKQITLRQDIAGKNNRKKENEKKIDNIKIELYVVEVSDSQLVSKPEKLKQLAECEQNVALLTAEANELQQKLSSIKIELREVLKKKEKMSKDNTKIIEELKNKLNASGKLIEDITELHNNITKYNEANDDKEIKLIENDLSKITYEGEYVQTHIEILIDIITKNKEEIAKQESLFRELKDNQVFREKIKEEESLKKEIDDLKKQIGEHNLLLFTMITQFKIKTRNHF